MKRSCAVVALLAAWIAPARAQQPADQVTYVDAAKVAEAFAKGGALATTGTDIQSGQTHQLKKGDFITIPAGIPHWFKDVPSSGITYYMVKVVKP